MVRGRWKLSYLSAFVSRLNCAIRWKIFVNTNILAWICVAMTWTNRAESNNEIRAKWNHLLVQRATLLNAEVIERWWARIYWITVRGGLTKSLNLKEKFTQLDTTRHFIVRSNCFIRSKHSNDLQARHIKMDQEQIFVLNTRNVNIDKFTT